MYSRGDLRVRCRAGGHAGTYMRGSSTGLKQIGKRCLCFIYILARTLWMLADFNGEASEGNNAHHR